MVLSVSIRDPVVDNGIGRVRVSVAGSNVVGMEDVADPGVDSVAPGPELGFVLAGTDVSTLGDDAALSVATACGRQLGWVHAQQVRVLARFADTRSRLDPYEPVPAELEQLVRYGGEGTPLVEEFAADELGAVLGISTIAAHYRLADALDLVHRHPTTLAALNRGEVDDFRARLLVRGTRRLPAQLARSIEARVLPGLARLSPAKIRGRVDAEAIAADPALAETDRDHSAARRGVWIGASCDGTRELAAVLDAGDATRLDARIDQVADWLAELHRRQGSTHLLESKEQRRATALGLLADPDEITRLWHQLHQLRSGAPDAPTSPSQQAPVPRTVLYVHLRQPLHADAVGTRRWDCDQVGPLTQAAAADLVGHSHVTVRPVIDLPTLAEAPPAPGTGYRPPAGLAEAVRLVFDTDVFPYGTTDARRCDLDHDQPWPTGPTTLANLSPKNRRHHRLKTHGNWTMARTGPAEHLWTSPTGRRWRVDNTGTHPLPRPSADATSHAGPSP